MKTSTKVLAGIGVAVVAAYITGYVIATVRSNKGKRMLSVISDEGYETARDILYPKNRGRDKLRYGPILPE
jgi:hypothetical protein